MDQPAASVATMSRRERRRRETIEEILDLSLEVMKQEGVARLNLTSVAKRLGVQPTAIYKYFPSLIAVYDALFRRAVDSLFRELSAAMGAAAPGMATVRAAVRSAAQWSVGNPELAQLLVWRPIPGYTAPPDALAPSVIALDMLSEALGDAADAGEISPEIAGMRGAHIIAVLLVGAVNMHFTDFGTRENPEDFIELVPSLVDMFVCAFSPSRNLVEK